MLSLEQYVLSKLGEECGEIQQAIGKALIFGLEDKGKMELDSNIDRIKREIHDLIGVYVLLMHIRQESPELNFNLIEEKIKKVAYWSKHSREQKVISQITYKVLKEIGDAQ